MIYRHHVKYLDTENVRMIVNNFPKLRRYLPTYEVPTCEYMVYYCIWVVEIRLTEKICWNRRLWLHAPVQATSIGTVDSGEPCWCWLCVSQPPAAGKATNSRDNAQIQAAEVRGLREG